MLNLKEIAEKWCEGCDHKINKECNWKSINNDCLIAYSNFRQTLAMERQADALEGIAGALNSSCKTDGEKLAEAYQRATGDTPCKK